MTAQKFLGIPERLPRVTYYLSNVWSVTRQRTLLPGIVSIVKYFASEVSLAGEEGKEVPPREQAPPGARRLRGFKVTRAKVSKVLRALVESKSVGPDGVSPRVLKHCAKELDGPLARLFQKVEKGGSFPGQLEGGPGDSGVQKG